MNTTMVEEIGKVVELTNRWMFDILQQQNLTNYLLVMCTVMLGLNLCLKIRSREFLLNAKHKEVSKQCVTFHDLLKPLASVPFGT
jgi:hypothetical protein